MQFGFNFMATELTYEKTPVPFVIGYVLQGSALMLIFYDFCCSDSYIASKVAIYVFNARLSLNFYIKLDDENMAKSVYNTAAIFLLILGNSLFLTATSMRYRNVQFVLTFIVVSALLAFKLESSLTHDTSAITVSIFPAFLIVLTYMIIWSQIH